MPTQMHPDRLAGMDFEAHNARTRQLWDDFRAGKPTRTPVFLGTNTRYYLLSPIANPERCSFRAYIESPDLMFRYELEAQRWARFNLLQDAELGMPERWMNAVDFQNYREAAWLGCPIVYLEGEVPDTLPAFADSPMSLLEQGIPDPFAGIMGTLLEYQQYFEARAAQEEYLGRPIGVHPPGPALGTDGPFTMACNVIGPEWICEALIEEPDQAQAVLGFLTEAILTRIQAWRKRYGIPERHDGFWLADDSIALISEPMFREHVLPYHQRLYDALGTDQERGMHLCGNATRHFRALVEVCKVKVFDTGFPVNFGALREELGNEVLIQGGPHVELLLHGTPAQIATRTREILNSGIRKGPFILREGNNLAPNTPFENTEAMVRTAWETP